MKLNEKYPGKRELIPLYVSPLASPVSCGAEAVEKAAIIAATKEIVEEFDLDQDLEGPYILISAIIRKHLLGEQQPEKESE